MEQRPQTVDYATPGASRPRAASGPLPLVVFLVCAVASAWMATQIGRVYGDSHNIAVFVSVFFGLAAIVLPLLIQLRRSRGDQG